MATTKKSRTRIRLTEPSTWAGLSILAGLAVPGLLTYYQTGSKTAGIIALLTALGGGAAVALPEKADKKADDEAK